MSSDVKDPAQKFADRVVGIVFYEDEWDFMEHLKNTIANELRAGGWVQLPAMIGRLEGALSSFAAKEMARLVGGGDDFRQ